MRTLRLAVTHDSGRVFTATLTALGGLWTLVEGLAFFLDKVESLRGWLLPVILSVALAYGVLRGTRPRSLEIRVGPSDTVLAIQVGDLFETPGSKVIPVNEFFDCDLGKHVAPRSVHGQFLDRCFAHRQQDFCDTVDAALRTTAGEEVTRQSGRTKRYAIGTTTGVAVGHECYLLTVVAHTDLVTLKANADVEDLWIAQRGLWKEARHLANGQDIVVPLLGGGFAGVGLPTRQLLDLLIMSIVQASEERKITDRIVVVLTESHLKDVDLRDVDRSWR